MALDVQPMAGYNPVVVKWGSDFGTELNLNNGIQYRGRSVDTFAGPEQEVILQDTTYGVPFDVRGKFKERVFSLWFEPVAQPYSALFYSLLNEAKKALYSGLVRVYLRRGFTADGDDDLLYLTARCEQIVEAGRGQFEARMTAADPYFYKDDGFLTYTQQMGFVGAPPGVGETDQREYIPMPLEYSGTAPGEPNIIFQIGGRSGVYAYYRTIEITNNAPYALRNYPICIDLGDITASVGTKFHELGTNTLGVDTHSIRDIRVESEGGARKFIFIRDSGMRGGTWHQSVKVWTFLESLEPGQTKRLRVLYGNPQAPGADIYPELSTVKAMFNMYNSTNGWWQYTDFMPTWNLPQTRAFQWTPYIPPRYNIAWIAHRHAHFDDLTGAANVNVAGARASLYGPAMGATGAQLQTPVGIAQVDYTYRISTNAKTPFMLRWQRRNLEWVDPTPTESTYHANGTSTMRAQLTANANAGDLIITLDRVVGNNPTVEYFDVNQGIVLNFSDGTTQRFTVSTVNSITKQITMTTAVPVGKTALAGTYVQASTSGSVTKTFNAAAADFPQVIAFVLRGDHPEMTTGDWYFGGAETVEITFDTTEQPTVTAWGSATEVDLNGTKFQLRGRFGNPATGEYLHVNTITHNLRDRVIVDCVNRWCWYQKWDPVLEEYEALVDIFDALSFEAVRYYWIHLEPDAANMLEFQHSDDSNFRDTDLYVEFNQRFY